MSGILHSGDPGGLFAVGGTAGRTSGGSITETAHHGAVSPGSATARVRLERVSGNAAWIRRAVWKVRVRVRVMLSMRVRVRIRVGEGTG